MELNKISSTTPSNLQANTQINNNSISSEIHVTCANCKRKFHRDNYKGHERYEKELERKLNHERNKANLILDQENSSKRRVKTSEYKDEIRQTGDFFLGSARTTDLPSKSDIMHILQKNKIESVNLNFSPLKGSINKEEYTPILKCRKCQAENLEQHENSAEVLDQIKEGVTTEYTCSQCR